MTDQDGRPNAAAAGTFTLGGVGGDLVVTRLGFGAMRLTGRRILGEPQDPEEARRVLRRAIELGVNLIDTADSYGPEVSERIIAEALHPYPEDLVIATKGGFTRAGGRWVGWWRTERRGGRVPGRWGPRRGKGASVTDPLRPPHEPPVCRTLPAGARGMVR